MSRDFDDQLDSGQLGLLSWLWYAWGGLSAFGGCGVGVLALLGGALGRVDGDPQLQDGAAVTMGALGCVALTLVLWGALNAYVGRSLVTGSNRMLIYGLAIVNLVSIPLGTVLGVFTLFVMSQPRVQDRFA